MSMEESISLEETNKIRIKLGLKPLTDDKAPAGDKEQEAEETKGTSRLVSGPCLRNSHLKRMPNSSIRSPRRIFDWAKHGDAVRAQ